MHVAVLAALAVILIAVIGAVATYIDNYFTESVGQWVAHDLRMRTYHHLQRLSLGYYDTHQTGSSAEHHHHRHPDHPGFRLVVDPRHPDRPAHHCSMVGLMSWLNWDFTLIALAVTPFLLLFVSRFKKAVKKATHAVRKEQAEIVAVVQQGLESVRAVKAFGRQEWSRKNWVR